MSEMICVCGIEEGVLLWIWGERNASVLVWLKGGCYFLGYFVLLSAIFCYFGVVSHNLLF